MLFGPPTLLRRTKQPHRLDENRQQRGGRQRPSSVESLAYGISSLGVGAQPKADRPIASRARMPPQARAEGVQLHINLQNEFDLRDLVISRRRWSKRGEAVDGSFEAPRSKVKSLADMTCDATLYWSLPLCRPMNECGKAP